MLKYFKCPDDETRLAFVDCLKCPRKEGRCLTLPSLKQIAQVREWKGKPSCTQCLNPTRMEFLKVTQDYAVDPKEQAYLLDGTRRHELLERAADNLESVKAEMRLSNGQTSGIADILEPDELKQGYWKLTDYKTWGSYAVAKWLDQQNKNGDTSRLDLELQLNNYRIMIESLNYPISKLQVQITVRDGGTSSAYKNGIMFKMDLFPVKRLEDEFVLNYFFRKSQALIKAMNSGVMPSLCDYKERWGGNRCKDWCDVFMFCPEGAKVNKVELRK